MSDHPLATLPRWTQQAWMDFAACRGRSKLFFPPLAERPQARVKREAKAQAICDTCPVQAPCRTYAREHREYGYWGGESEEQRTQAGFSVPNPIGGRRRRIAASTAPRHTDGEDELSAAS
jgi:WhiB family transcriptional regulator, redox-sensing transcriptional regulator